MLSRHRELLARSILHRLDVTRYADEPEYRAEIDNLIDDGVVGGFVAMDGEIDLVRATLAALQVRAGGRLLMAADCEFGVTMRFPGGTEFPSMMALGSGGNLSTTYTAARTIAVEMAAMGFHWNFAPVADVNVEPRNPIINIRSFGQDPQTVADHVEAYVRGTQDAGIVACAKHFPGHGDTAVDSHRSMPTLPHDRSRLDAVELVPFGRAVASGVRSVMTGHIAVPALDPSGLPASLSRSMTTELLREELGFGGVIVTDALDMGAITETYSSGETAVRAYTAGADVLIFLPDPRAGLDALVAAAERGEIAPERVERTAEMVDGMRRWASSAVANASLTARARLAHAELALEAARRTVRVEGEGSPFGFDPETFVLALVDSGGAEACAEWLDHLAAWRPNLRAAVVTAEIGAEEQGEIATALNAASSVLLALFVRPRAYAGSVGLTSGQGELARRALEHPCALLCFGNPWLLRDAAPALRIDTYGTGPASLAVAVERLAELTGVEG